MLVVINIEGSLWGVEEVDEIPCLGEVVTLQGGDYVVSSLILAASPSNAAYVPIISLLPIVSHQSGLTEA